MKKGGKEITFERRVRSKKVTMAERRSLAISEPPQPQVAPHEASPISPAAQPQEPQAQLLTPEKRGMRTKRTISRRILTETNSSDDDEEEEYRPSPARSSAADVEMEEENEESEDGLEGASEEEAGNEDEEGSEEEFEEGSEIPVIHDGMNYGKLEMKRPQNPGWRAKENYNGKIDLVRRMRAMDPRQLQDRTTDYRFQTAFQQDFYESVVLAKKNPVAVAQWINWERMAAMNVPAFNNIIAACEAKHVKDIMGFKHDWNNEVIAQFFATCFFEEHENERILHWRTEGTWFKVSYAQFARLFGFGMRDANRPKIHLQHTLKDIDFMYPRSVLERLKASRKKDEYGDVKGMYPFYVYLNRMFRKTLAPKEGDASRVAGYTKNLMAAMRDNGYPFSVFDFIWEEIKLAASSPLRSCGYAPYIMHMIEYVTKGKFEYDMEHLPLTLKANIREPAEAGSADAGAASAPPPSRDARGSGSSQGRSSSPIKKLFNMLFGMCRTQHDIQVKLQRIERQQRNIEKNLNTMRNNAELDTFSPVPPESPDIESFEDQMARYQQEDYASTYFGEDFTSADFWFGAAGPSHSAAQPPVTSPPPAHEEEEGEEEDDDDDEDDE